MSKSTDSSVTDDEFGDFLEAQDYSHVSKEHHRLEDVVSNIKSQLGLETIEELSEFELFNEESQESLEPEYSSSFWKDILQSNFESTFNYESSELRRMFLTALEVPINLDVIKTTPKKFGYTKEELLEKGKIITENNNFTSSLELASINEAELKNMSLEEMDILETQLNSLNEDFSIGIEYLRDKINNYEDDTNVYNKMAANLIENAQKSNTSKKHKKP